MKARSDPIRINFPVLEMGRKLKAEVAFWYPCKKGEILQDIAVLRLPDAERLPDGATPVKFIEIGSRELWGHRFRALGFPEKGSNGEWACGELRGRVGRGRIQLEGVTETGLSLQEGFSGTPIWDEDLQGVVGMAVMKDGKRPEAKGGVHDADGRAAAGGGFGGSLPGGRAVAGGDRHFSRSI